jgi:ubiquitin carboxyl-terminal hydrolase 14
MVTEFSFWRSGKWIEFDDDNPNIRKEEDILKLSGGGER